jgi:hypothetical protein
MVSLWARDDTQKVLLKEKWRFFYYILCQAPGKELLLEADFSLEFAFDGDSGMIDKFFNENDAPQSRLEDVLREEARRIWRAVCLDNSRLSFDEYSAIFSEIYKRAYLDFLCISHVVLVLEPAVENSSSFISSDWEMHSEG